MTKLRLEITLLWLEEREENVLYNGIAGLCCEPWTPSLEPPDMNEDYLSKLLFMSSSPTFKDGIPTWHGRKNTRDIKRGPGKAEKKSNNNLS